MATQLKIKVCGMKFTQNREQVEKLPVDLLGFIFYPPSKRYVGEIPQAGLFDTTISKAGVFVNRNAFEILSLSKKYGLEWVQLHGGENPKTCKLLKDQGLKIIKAFNLDESFSFEKTIPFHGVADYFLFDTKTGKPGGSGKKFNWGILNNYKGTVPFLLSGGIRTEDAATIKNFNHPRLAGIDLNSGFEDEPGLKNPDKLEEFIKQIKENI